MSDSKNEHWLYAITPAWMIRRILVPRGVLGTIVGHNMARINAEMNGALVEMLELNGDEQVLEIGFGSGVAVRMLSEALPGGHVSGVDPSGVMLRQAIRRNRTAIRAGRVDLRLGNVVDMPWKEGCFDVACAVDTIQIWDSMERGAKEVHRLLRTGGRFGVSVHEYAAHGLSDSVPLALEHAGFKDISLHRDVDRSGSTFHFLAHT